MQLVQARETDGPGTGEPIQQDLITVLMNEPGALLLGEFVPLLVLVALRCTCQATDLAARPYDVALAFAKTRPCCGDFSFVAFG